MANELSVTYRYDNLVGGFDAMMNTATVYCKKYGKSPVPTESGKLDVLYTQTFECR